MTHAHDGDPSDSRPEADGASPEDRAAGDAAAAAGFGPIPGAVADPFGVAPATVEPPTSVLNAVRLMWAGAVVQLVGIAVGLYQLGNIRELPEVKEAIADGREAGLSERQLDRIVDTASTGGAVFGVVIGGLAIGLWIWMAVQNGKGRRWARTTATVLGVLGVLFSIVGIAQGGIGVIGSVLSLILAAVIVFLLYRPDANRFFAHAVS